jgi:hypothetical protein
MRVVFLCYNFSGRLKSWRLVNNSSALLEVQEESKWEEYYGFQLE